MTKKFEAFFTYKGKEHEMKGISASDRIMIGGIAGRQNFVGCLDPELISMKDKLSQKDPEKWTPKEKEQAVKISTSVTNKMLSLVDAERDTFFSIWSNMTGLTTEQIKNMDAEEFDSLFDAFKKVGGFEAFTKAVESLMK
ncbi:MULTISPECIES: hypothetical protein [unclassified Bacillus cereus group]|uniref:hypothetical protein n=1 Tax=unclassified Bacillus cereus group TaxID=2750818 RepID=UPI001F55AEDE|nr:MULTISPECIES: hypothetical protein [unclassified Bacillus cereus group]